MAKKRIKDLDVTATTSDLKDGNYLVLDGAEGTKKFPAGKMADKPITGTDVPTDPPAYEGQICSVSQGSYPHILVGVKKGSALVWRQVAISGSEGLPANNNIIVGGDNSVGDTTSSTFGGIFCGSSNKVSAYACVCIGGSSCTASNTQAATLGGSGCKASGTQSVTLGGAGCEASGYECVCLGGGGGNASGAFSVTIGGQSCKASNSMAVTIGGGGCTASGSMAVTLGGASCEASGSKDVTIGGDHCEASGTQSVTLGGQNCKTTKIFQVAMGQNNDPEQDDGNVLFMVGGGTSDTRANVFTISKTGVPKAMAGQYNVPCCKTGTAAPDAAPDYVGQEYLDTAQKKVYKAVGTTDASDWVLLN